MSLPAWSSSRADGRPWTRPSVPQQVEVCATCRAAAEEGIAVADPLVLDSGRGRMQAYWMLEVKPWAEIGYGVASRELIDAWSSPRV